MSRTITADHSWVRAAAKEVAAESARVADTHLYRYPLPAEWGVSLYLKDESAHPTGSLKHRLARSLVSDGLHRGLITDGTTLVEASSGSTAVSVAYFARLLTLSFVAVVPRSTSAHKVALIESYGGRCVFVERPEDVSPESRRVAAKVDGHFLDQFTNAAAVTDWRSDTGLAHSLSHQLRLEPHPRPEWIVVGAGTGGTSATVARYARHHSHPTRICVVDPEGSAYLDAWRTGKLETSAPGSRIEGIGRPRVESSFHPELVDEVLRVPDAASVAGMQHLYEVFSIDAGPSSGTNLWGALTKVAQLRSQGRTGSVATLICDRGDRYVDTFKSARWLASQGLDSTSHLDALRAFGTRGVL